MDHEESQKNAAFPEGTVDLFRRTAASITASDEQYWSGKREISIEGSPIGWMGQCTAISMRAMIPLVKSATRPFFRVKRMPTEVEEDKFSVDLGFWARRLER
jgi:hypothetical protein